MIGSVRVSNPNLYQARIGIPLPAHVCASRSKNLSKKYTICTALSGRPVIDNSDGIQPTRMADVTMVSDQGFPRTAVIGVLGGGQLGKMMSLAAVRDSI